MPLVPWDTERKPASTGGWPVRTRGSATAGGVAERSAGISGRWAVRAACLPVAQIAADCCVL
jgi:hypothetical protein